MKIEITSDSKCELCNAESSLLRLVILHGVLKALCKRCFDNIDADTRPEGVG